MKRIVLLLAPCLALACAMPSLAADAAADAQLQALDARVRALEAEGQKLREQAAAALAAAESARAELERMKTAQQAPAAAPAAAPIVAEAPAPAPVASGSASANAFNPAIAVILNGVYAHHSLDPAGYARAGFPLVEGTGPGPQGLSLGESEVTFAANIDDKFYGQFTLSYEDANGEVGTSIEEAYIDTTALPQGFSLRAGRFYSDIGYLNSHHTHTDNFVDRPLAYQAFLANQYGDDGVQLRWVAPTDLFLEFGSEAFRGDNYPAAGAGHAGVGTHTLFAHAGGDVGIENSWLAGLSVLKANANAGADGFSGDDTLYLADATWKWAPHGNTKDGGVSVRGEYFLDRRDGSVAAPTADAAFDPLLDPRWVGQRRGAYLEGIYRFNRTWDAGYRFDKLWAAGSGPYASAFDPVRHSLELTWRNSEFSFFRVQYSHDDPLAERSDNALYLQYDVSLGAHGAHSY
jgi:hypothetical protein